MKFLTPFAGLSAGALVVLGAALPAQATTIAHPQSTDSSSSWHSDQDFKFRIQGRAWATDYFRHGHVVFAAWFKNTGRHSVWAKLWTKEGSSEVRLVRPGDVARLTVFTDLRSTHGERGVVKVWQSNRGHQASASFWVWFPELRRHHHDWQQQGDQWQQQQGDQWQQHQGDQWHQQ